MVASKTRTCLITGATGFIGRVTAMVLARYGWLVTKGSRLTNDNHSRQREGVVFIDLTKPETLFALEKKGRFDAIIHLGACVEFNKTAAELFVPNVLSTGCLAYLAKLWDAQLIFASTAIVHGARTEIIEADSPLCLDTSYAKSKWLSEQLLAASNIKYCVLRIAGVFGPGGPAHLSLNRTLDEAKKGNPPQQIGTGRALRNYIYVKDVAEAIVFALQEHLGGTHLLAGHDIMSINEMLNSVREVFCPGYHLILKEGVEAMNQVIRPSTLFPKTRGFREALADIQEMGGQ